MGLGRYAPSDCIADEFVGTKGRHMRRRRTKYTWMPVLGSHVFDEPDSRNFSMFRILPAAPDVSSAKVSYVYFPIVPDGTHETGSATDATDTLADRVSGNDWLLKRLVGKLQLFARASTGGANSQVYWSQILCTAGFLVARSDDSDSNVIDMSANEFDPQDADNAQDPWIWRRTWTLTNPLYAALNVATERHWYNQPTTNTQYGSVLDGPHIDSKVARRITREHRLFFVLSLSGGDPNVIAVTGTQENQPTVDGWLDLRVLGALRKQRNRSSF